MYSASNNASLFKETYEELSKNHYNSSTPLLSRVKKNYKLQGTKAYVSIPTGMAGSVGGLVNGYLPTPGTESGLKLEITAKDVVITCRVDRKSMKQAMTDRGSWVRFTKRPVEMAVKTHDHDVNLLLHGAGNGRVCKTKATGAYVSGGAATPIIEMDSTEWVERWFRKNMLLNIGDSGDTGVEDALFSVTSIDATNKRVTFRRESGTYDVSASTNANARFLYLQNMFKSAPNGIEGTIMATSGNIYNLAYDEQVWGSLHEDASSAPPSISLLNKVMNKQMTRVDEDELPDFLLTSNEIWAILSDIQEGQKRIMLQPRDKKLAEAGFGFSGLSYTCPNGKVIPIVADKHCKTNRIYGINSSFIEMHHLPDHGWWDDDKSVFLRVPNRPWYEATYGGYFDTIIHPTFQFVIKNVGI